MANGVTDFKIINRNKAYLSAILDLGDNSIISYVLDKSNNNKSVFDPLYKAVEANQTAMPLFHSDCRFQYTCKTFNNKLNN
ncbi:hypothetical protein [Clostridium celatum]|uniref:hypothetical protein n=1 Tax=Clostridium celatum TaxID=36834 RepID=UPI00189A99A6|nr:hypothetical protein [Clostridium celatum]